MSTPTHDGNHGCEEQTGGPTQPNGRVVTAGHPFGGDMDPNPVPSAPLEAQPAVPTAADIFLLARQQNLSVAAKLLEACPQHWTAEDEDGHSLLHWGALVGNTEFARLAVQNGCPVDVRARNQQTPLMWAVLRGHVPVMKVLLDAKACPRSRDSLGATALMIAIQHKSYEALLLLMHRGGPVLLTDVDKNGCSAAHWAAYKGDLVALKLLDYFEADLQALDNSKMIPLHRAVVASQVGVVDFLLERKADPTLRNSEGKTCLDLAEGQADVHLQSLMRKLLKRAEVSAGQDADAEQGLGGPAAKEDFKENDGCMKSLMKDKSFQRAFPVFWLVCVSLATFEYLTDLRHVSYEVAPRVSMLFELGVPASLVMFAWVALADPGKVPARPKGQSGVEELMRALDGGAPAGQIPDFSRLCTTTWVLKGLRTKYCAQTGACVEDFDHYCVWLNTSIGKNNHRQFICLAVLEWLTQLCHLYLCWLMAWTLVPFPTWLGWFFGVLTGYPLLALLSLVQALTIPWVLMLIIHQLRLVAMNLTTNEVMNAHRYEHFWVAAAVMPGRVQKVYRNPFDKGGTLKNCLDFWWFKQRSQVSGKPACSASCHGCHHGPHS